MRGAGGPRIGLHVRVGGLLRLGLVLACTLVEPLSLPRMSVGAGWGSGPGQGAAVVARSSGMLRLRGGVRFEEVLTAMDMIQLPLDNKGAKKKRRNPITPIERDIAQVLFALREEPGLRMLKYLHIVSAQEMEISKSKERAVVMFIPYVEMMEYRKIRKCLAVLPSGARRTFADTIRPRVCAGPQIDGEIQGAHSLDST